MKTNQKNNSMLAIAAGVAVLTLQAGGWGNSLTLTQGHRSMSSQEGAATEACTNCEQESITTLREEVRELRTLLNNRIQQSAETSSESTEETADEEKPLICSDKEDALDELECLANKGTKEAEEAFMIFMFGDTNIPRCLDGLPENFGETGFIDALSQDSKKALRAAKKAIRKVKRNRRSVSCHMLNMAKEFHNEETQTALTPMLRRIDQQLLALAGKDDLWSQQRRIQLEDQRRSLVSSNDLYSKTAQFDAIFQSTASSILRGESPYNVNYGSRGGAFGDVYDWYQSIEMGQYDLPFYDSPLDRLNGDLVAGGPQSNWLRSRFSSPRLNGYNEIAGLYPMDTLPLYGKSALSLTGNPHLNNSMGGPSMMYNRGMLPGTRSMPDTSMGSFQYSSGLGQFPVRGRGTASY